MKGPNTTIYVGSTEDLRVRLEDHNTGRSPHTAKYRPWKLAWYCVFHQRTKAEGFERYLKSASGRSFQKKHLCFRPYDGNLPPGI